MAKYARSGRGSMVILRAIVAVWLVGMSLPSASAAATLTVEGIGQDGSSVAVSEYRWLLQEDATHHVDPATPPASPTDPPTIRFHASYMPVVASGTQATPLPATLDPAKHYFVSVVPRSGYTMGGARFQGNAGGVIVSVNALPLPTAQVSIFAFDDNHPINNNPDLPAESGLEGWRVILEDAGGRYGMVGGQLLYDIYGNALGTEYVVDVNGDPVDTDGDGVPDVAAMGDGNIFTDENGFAQIKNLGPGKYGLQLVPPDNNAGGWQQTTTIEGTKVIDAWVKSNEPVTLIEFGVPSTHVFMGFVRACDGQATSCDGGAPALTGGHTISGEVANFHFSRPPNLSLTAAGHTLGDVSPIWIGLNDQTSGRGVYAREVADGTFSIAGVPDGTYQLVAWDTFLNIIIAFQNVVVSGADVDVGRMVVPEWFTHLWNFVFLDRDEDGFPDELDENGFPVGSEPGMLEQGINIRFRDGTIYQSFPTDGAGYIPFDKVFPFFNWQIAEVDFLRFKATGATIVVDEGGKVLTGMTGFPHHGRLRPQAQPDNGGAPYRTEKGVVLLEGFQGFPGDTNVIYWGKAPYKPGEHGGISGIVFYEITRAEDDPRYAAFEPWEPGIPRIQVNLYQDADGDGAIDDVWQDPADPAMNTEPAADVDNHPFGWFDGSGPKGPEDADHDGDGIFDAGDAIQIVWTDSWDDNPPEGCPGDPADPFYNGGQCYDGVRNFNQVRPAVFDGGYAFDSYVPGGVASGAEEQDLPVGAYIVEVTRGPFQVYEHRVEEAKSVDFGETFVPSKLLLPPPCVGEPHTVPPYLTLFGDWDKDGVCDPGQECIEAPFAWEDTDGDGDLDTYVALQRPLCNRKQVTVTSGFNAAADFSLYTDVPPAAQTTGLVTNDLANEFDPRSPNFIEKYGAPFIPIAFRDYRGREIARVYTDQWGVYDALLSSTFTTNTPSPSGVTAAMHTVCINDAGPLPNGQIDSLFKPEYTQSCYTFQFMPATTTYLDTPVLPISGFAGRETFPLDCQFPTGTPVIESVDGEVGGVLRAGGYVANPSPLVGDNRLVIRSLGITSVRNPAFNPFDPLSVEPPAINRNYGFSGNGTARLERGATVIPLDIINWNPSQIRAEVPAGTAPGRYQLVVRRGDNGMESAVMGLTVTVGPLPAGVAVRRVSPGPGAIQAAIDAASSGDLILVAPGTYDELVVLYKDVVLQGSGAPSTIINAVKAPVEKVQLWQEKVEGLVRDDPSLLLPNQDPEFSLFPKVGLLPTERGSGILVLAPSSGGEPVWDAANHAVIDGLTVRNADNGGGILLNGYAAYVEIGNSRLYSNSGIHGGGIRSGHPITPFAFEGEAVDAKNRNVRIHHNHILQNGAIGEGGVTYGGGIALYNGSDGYQVTDNSICGNFSIGGGAGIGHRGLSDEGQILRNQILFNHQFHQTPNQAAGGGIAIEGLPPDPMGPLGTLTEGSGSVLIDSNLILGNLSGTGDGAGIRLALINGQEPTLHQIRMVNNIIVNNVSGLAGAGISLQDAADVRILHNTIARNDNYATAGEAFSGPLAGVSVPQPGAGIAARPHSDGLAARVDPDYPDPMLANNVIWQNRIFHFDVRANCDPPGSKNCNGGLLPDVSETGANAPPVFSDLAVIGLAGANLDPRSGILTSVAGYHSSNRSVDPGLVRPYFTGSAGNLIVEDRLTLAQAAAALDEGGNFVDVRYGPLSIADPLGVPFGDYHLDRRSPAINTADGAVLAANPGLLDNDVDGDARPGGAGPDVGADEIIQSSGQFANRLVFVDPNQIQLPIASHSFSRVAAGTLTWSFAFDWDRTGGVGGTSGYQLAMQLGDGGTMNQTNLDTGVAVNLVWTNIPGAGADDEWLGYRAGVVNTRLMVIAGVHTISVAVDLATNTYRVSVDGSPVGPVIPFTNPVDIDTVRFVSHLMPPNRFLGRTFDDVTISVP